MTTNVEKFHNGLHNDPRIKCTPNTYTFIDDPSVTYIVNRNIIASNSHAIRKCNKCGKFYKFIPSHLC